MDIDVRYLGRQAERCRRLAADINDATTRSTLLELADEYDRRAKRLKPQEKPAA